MLRLLLLFGKEWRCLLKVLCNSKWWEESHAQSPCLAQGLSDLASCGNHQELKTVWMPRAHPHRFWFAWLERQPQLRNTVLVQLLWNCSQNYTVLLVKSRTSSFVLLKSCFTPVWFISKHINCHLTVLITWYLLLPSLVLHFLTILIRPHFFFVCCLSDICKKLIIPKTHKINANFIFPSFWSSFLKIYILIMVCSPKVKALKEMRNSGKHLLRYYIHFKIYFGM